MDSSSRLVLDTVSVLERLGVGASKKGSLFLKKTDVFSVVELIRNLVSVDGDKFEREEVAGNSALLIWKVGEWGHSISGAQRMEVRINKKGDGIELEILSKSVMGQLKDWGTNDANIKRLAYYLENPKLGVPAKVKPNKSGKFAFLLLLVPLILFVLYMLLDLFELI